MAPAKKKSRKNDLHKEPTVIKAPQLLVETSQPSVVPPSDTDVPVSNMVNPQEPIAHPDPPPVSEPPQTSLKETNFENIFYKPETQVTALSMLNDHLQSISKSIPSGSNRYRSLSGEDSQVRNLRSSDPKPEKQGLPKTDNPVPGKSTNVPSKPGTSNEGVAMVQELLHRYETNKKKAKYGSKEEVKEKRNVAPLDDDDDDFEFDENELDLWDDEENEPGLKSDFLKYTVPQYDMKQKLCNMHYSTIKRMTPSEVEKSCVALLPELKEIADETVFSKRHDMFKKSGISKHALREISVAEPFTSAQDNRVANVINDNLFADKDEFNGELLQYVSHVLVPEALIRIYASTNKISVELAEKELRYGGGYDGDIDDDLMKKLNENVGLVKSESVV